MRIANAACTTASAHVSTHLHVQPIERADMFFVTSESLPRCLDSVYLGLGNSRGGPSCRISGDPLSRVSLPPVEGSAQPATREFIWRATEDGHRLLHGILARGQGSEKGLLKSA